MDRRTFLRCFGAGVAVAAVAPAHVAEALAKSRLHVSPMLTSIEPTAFPLQALLRSLPPRPNPTYFQWAVLPPIEERFVWRIIYGEPMPPDGAPWPGRALPFEGDSPGPR